jgi:PIN domain nuclease of toxin-antitoxin system
VRLLLDTHVLIWVPTGDPRVSATAREAMQRADAELFVSAVTAFELADLQMRGRVAMTEPISAIAAALGLTLVDLPADLWTIASRLPLVHGDPIDRMLIAHAIAGDYAVVTADSCIRRYPVQVIW